MFFYIDESGHTGTNLFDANQPILYYGVLSSKTNIDLLSRKHISSLRQRLGVNRLHANELGNAGLTSLVSDLISLQKRFHLRVDVYRVIKRDYALICFFDQVFDQGINPAVPWSSYWTPLRYVLLLKLSALFDEKNLIRAWNARIELNAEKAEKVLVSICSEIRSLVHYLPDERSRQIISDALFWAQTHPKKIGYNTSSKEEIKMIAPNLIGFQLVLHGIGSRIINHRVRLAKVIVDRQTQFNKAQTTLGQYYANASKNQKNKRPIDIGTGLPSYDYRGIPQTPIEILSSFDSIGLELVDIYLWIFRRYMENKELSPELLLFFDSQANHGRANEVSINALVERWTPWFENKPGYSKFTDKQKSEYKEWLEFQETQRQKNINEAENS